MAKEIWLGPLLGNNRERLIERCSQLVSEGAAESFIYLAASRPLLELVSAQLLDGARNVGLWGELPVYLFRGFVRRIVSTATAARLSEDQGAAGGAPTNVRQTSARTPIDREEFPLKRSLISQILKRLDREKKLKAIGPLAARDGCVNSIVTLLGEIQRAGKTPAELAEIVARRVEDLGDDIDRNADRTVEKLRVQTDFDKDVALIYATYADLLNEHQLTEDDADGLRALQILRGEATLRLPWLDGIKLLVLDGFFDFTPAQGEILRLLIPQVPDVIVNLNNDERNPEIFKPFEETINQLGAIADFQIRHNSAAVETSGALSRLREKLFNPTLTVDAVRGTATDSASLSGRGTPASGEAALAVVGARHAVPLPDVEPESAQSQIRYFDCTDRETEIRSIAKEIKRLVLLEGFKLSEIALVVRERASYAETIARVMREESLPCNVERTVVAGDIPAARAALKLLSVLNDLSSDESSVLKMPQLADQIKSGYFRLSPDDLNALTVEFDQNFLPLLRDNGTVDARREEKRRRDFGVGQWDADALENVIAYVGAELRLSDWLQRSNKLITELPAADATKDLLNIDAFESSGDDEDTQLEDAETIQPEDKQVEKKRRPQRDVHPAAIAWAALVIKAFAARIQAVPDEGAPRELRLELMKLLDRFQFPEQVTAPIRHSSDDELQRATLDVHALEALRRAMLTAVKSIEITRTSGRQKPKLITLIDEVRRCLSSQTVTLANADRDGLRVFEATDVRGLRFRAVFIAGLVEGGFPLSASRDWIYPHEERERLKHYGLTLEDISPDTLLKEEHYFYQAACRATELLYLTRPLLLDGDAETVASYYIEELRRAIAPWQLRKEEVARPDYDGKRLPAASSARELAVGLVRQEQRHLHSPDKTNLLPRPQVSRMLSLAHQDGLVGDSALRRIAIERERWGEGFGPYDGQISDPHLLALLNRRLGVDVVHSASGLGTFGTCAYRFFAQRVLKLEPRGEAALDLQALDAGKLLHDILRRFFEKYRGRRFQNDKREELSRELLQIADEVFDQHERVVPPLNQQIWKLDREIRKIILDQVLLYELDVQSETESSAVAPARFELAFGGMKSAAKDPHSIDEPLQLSRSTFVGEEIMRISGQIDRVDIAADGTLVAYDYKLSKGARREDIYEGRTLQIPIYLEALEQLFFPGQRIAGGGYYTLRGGTERRNTGMYRKEFNDEYLRLAAKNSIFADNDWQQFRAQVITRIWDFFDRMRAGQFHVMPSEGLKSCKFCDYAALCRYDKYRIERKKR
ncbi:MAG TPA: PD-(D/E)XK nuclease family protein [Pyrinomonadaceae bacterium]